MRNIIVFFTLLSLFVGCSKDSLDNIDSSINKSNLTIEQIEMLQKMKETSLILTNMANNDEVNSELASLILEEKYKGDFVLFKDLFKHSNEEGLKSEKCKVALFEKIFDQTQNSNALKSSELNDLKEYLKKNNLALYIPYPLEDYPEGFRVPTISYHPLDNQDTNEGFEPIIENGIISGYKTVMVNEEYSLTRPVYLIIPKKEDELYSKNKSSVINDANLKSAASYPVDTTKENIAIELKEYYVANDHQFDGIFAGESELRIVKIELFPLSQHKFTPMDDFIDCTTKRRAIRRGTVIPMGTVLKTDWKKAENIITVGAYDYDTGYWDISDGRVGFQYTIKNSGQGILNWKDTLGIVVLQDTMTINEGFTIGGTFRFKLESNDDLLGQQTWGRDWISTWVDGEKFYSFGDFKCTFTAVSY
jgi:hypothetical protein